MTYEYTVEAFNTATASTNRMHDDAVAQTYGFRGGLVPGVDVWAYMTRPCVDRWGEDFLTSSMMEVRFVSPVYDGEVVAASLAEDGRLRVLGPDGSTRASGRVALAEPPAVVVIGEALVPDPAPSVTADLLAAGTTLGTLRFRYRRELAARYLAEVRETSAVYRGGEVCHPGFLARLANTILKDSVTLGPWIHVSTTAHHRGLVRDGDDIEVRGRVAARYERKGHQFVDLQVEISVDDAAVWSAVHTAIWQPRPVTDST